MKKLIAATAIAAAIVQAPAQAQTLDAVLGGIDFSAHGFVTAGTVFTNTNDAQFVRGAEPAGADKSPAENVDSTLGLQVTARFNDWISATVQALDDSGTETDDIAWAYLKIDPIKNLSVKLGKVELPLFMISDSRDVGYANNWVRPPNEVYALSLNEELKGGEATYSLPVAGTHLSGTVYAGNSTAYALGTSYPSWEVRGGEVRWESDWVTVRGSYTSEENDLKALIGFPEHDKYTFKGYGLSTDHDNIVAQAEWVKRTSAGYAAIVNATGWYVFGGYRFGTVLPYLSYASTAPDAGLAPEYLSGQQNTKAVGVRWDFLKSADIKFQFERVDPKGTQGISFVNQNANFGNSTVSVTTILVDFVF